MNSDNKKALLMGGGLSVCLALFFVFMWAERHEAPKHIYDVYVYADKGTEPIKVYEASEVSVDAYGEWRFTLTDGRRVRMQGGLVVSEEKR